MINTWLFFIYFHESTPPASSSFSSPLSSCQYFSGTEASSAVLHSGIKLRFPILVSETSWALKNGLMLGTWVGSRHLRLQILCSDTVLPQTRNLRYAGSQDISILIQHRTNPSALLEPGSLPVSLLPETVFRTRLHLVSKASMQSASQWWSDLLFL